MTTSADTWHRLPAGEEHIVQAADGWRLSLLDFVPEGPAWGVVILGHAMMVDRRTLCRPDRPTLAATLVASGLRVLAPDLRGRGGSGPSAKEGGDWTYDDHVDDTQLFVDLARTLEPNLPCVLIGHSLFGHTSLAWLGQHVDARIAACVHLGVCVWTPNLETSTLRWGGKRTLLALVFCAVRLFGRLPAQALGISSVDEAAGYWWSFRQWCKSGSWSRPDGLDYGAGVPGIQTPLLTVVSDGDRLFGHPRDCLAFTAVLDSTREVVHLGRADPNSPLAPLRPTHMGLTTDPASAPLWTHVVNWLRRTLADGLNAPDNGATSRS